jgi:hypothetical protein
MDWVQLSLPVCYSLHLAILGESHEAALKLCRVCCGLINKVQLTFPCHNVLQKMLCWTPLGLWHMLWLAMAVEVWAIAVSTCSW